MFSFSLRSFCTALIVLLTVLTLASCANVRAPHPKLTPFTSDGCTLFPDGTRNDGINWCDCCQKHDLVYWQGGSAEERDRADATLRDCVLARTHDQQLAEAMYLGVRVGGHPAFPAWYRWGYGWPYGRGYQLLSDEEREQVREGIDAYTRQHPAGFCDEKMKKP